MKELYPDVEDFKEFLGMQREDKRPSFQSVRERNHLSREQIAKHAGMTVEDVTRLEEIGRGTEAEIVRLITALNNVIHTKYGMVNFAGFTCTDRPEINAK
jgi:hypothetical protein